MFSVTCSTSGDENAEYSLSSNGPWNDEKSVEDGEVLYWRCKHSTNTTGQMTCNKGEWQTTYNSEEMSYHPKCPVEGKGQNRIYLETSACIRS